MPFQYGQFVNCPTNINNDKNGEVFIPRRFVKLMIIQNNSGLIMLHMIIAKLWKYEPIQYP